MAAGGFQRRICVLTIAAVAMLLGSGREAEAHVGTGIDLDREGRIYFTDTYHNCIWRLDSNGTVTLVVSGVHLDYLIVSEDGYVNVIKDGIWKINPQGAMIEVLDSKQFPEGGRPLCIDRQANIYFINSDDHSKHVAEISKRTPVGKVMVIVGSDRERQDGQGGEIPPLSHVNSAICAPDGSLYLRDDQTIRRVASDGTISTLAHSEDAAMAEDGEERLVRTMGMAVDAAGNVYVANYWKRAVMKVTPDGLVSAMATAAWPWVPVGVAISGNNIYALERMGNPYGLSTALEASTLADRLGSPRIRKISPDGTITTLVVVKGNRSLAVIIVPLILAAAVISVWLMRRRRAKRV